MVPYYGADGDPHSLWVAGLLLGNGHNLLAQQLCRCHSMAVSLDVSLSTGEAGYKIGDSHMVLSKEGIQ